MKSVHSSKYTSERVYGLLLCRRWVTPTLLYNGNCVIVRNRLLVSPCSITFSHFSQFLPFLVLFFFSFSCTKCKQRTCIHTSASRSESLTGHYSTGLLPVIVCDGCVSSTATSLLSFSVSVKHIHMKEDLKSVMDGKLRDNSRIMSSAASTFHLFSSPVCILLLCNL